MGCGQAVARQLEKHRRELDVPTPHSGLKSSSTVSSGQNSKVSLFLSLLSC